MLKIVSGGQTGVDRGALDAAQAAGVPTGGWCPRERRAEDGMIPAKYPLRETKSVEYSERTRLNVRDSDATLILLLEQPPVGGTALTIEAARKAGKPHRIVDLRDIHALPATAAWIRENDINVLNVAGPRESEMPGIYEKARAFIEALLKSI